MLGPSGCGKTTTLRMIAGLETPTEGEIYFDDECVFSDEKGINLSPDKRNIGFLFQNYALWPHMTVYKNISFGLENMKWPKDKIDARVKEICRTMRIEEYIDVLHKSAQILMEKEKITREEFEALFDAE